MNEEESTSTDKGETEKCRKWRSRGNSKEIRGIRGGRIIYGETEDLRDGDRRVEDSREKEVEKGQGQGESVGKRKKGVKSREEVLAEEGLESDVVFWEGERDLVQFSEAKAATVMEESCRN